MNVGVIGLGMMGSQIALRLAVKGHKVTVFNRDRSKAEKILTTGATNLKLVDHPKEIGNISDMAIICVKHYQAVCSLSLHPAASHRRVATRGSSVGHSGYDPSHL